MRRAQESIGRFKIEIEHKQRTKCCNLQHFELSGGKKLRKYHSFIPRKWLKHCYLQGFVNVTIFEFLKTHKYPHFLRSSTFCGHSKKCVNTSFFAINPPEMLEFTCFSLLSKTLLFAMLYGYMLLQSKRKMYLHANTFGTSNSGGLPFVDTKKTSNKQVQTKNLNRKNTPCFQNSGLSLLGHKTPDKG